jgi:putative molybdopterin biosynthesis protein
LSFIPLGPEHYDFAVVAERRERPAVRAFLAALADPETRRALRRLGFTPSSSEPA